MSGPYDPNQQWSSGQPGQEPSPSEPTQHAGWQPPAYSPQQYPQGQPYSPTEQAAAAQPTQYGQPQQYQAPQYGQQYPVAEGYGQQGQYPPAGAQYGEAPSAFGDASTAEKGSKSSLAVLGAVIGVLAAIIVAVVLVMGLWKPGFFVTTKLDVNKAQQGVKDILTNQTTGYGVDNVTDVKCNDGKNPTVTKGDTFTCDASVDGTHKQVTVTFQDDNGTYEVGRPK